jgi:hypothetical protein
MELTQSILELKNAFHAIGVALMIAVFAPVIVSTIMAIFKLRAFK